MHQFYLNILAFVNINLFLYINYQFALQNASKSICELWTPPSDQSHDKMKQIISDISPQIITLVHKEEITLLPQIITRVLI